MFKITKYLKKTQKKFKRDDEIITENICDYLDDKIDELEKCENKYEADLILADIQKTMSDRDENKRLHKIALLVIETLLKKLDKKDK